MKKRKRKHYTRQERRIRALRSRFIQAQNAGRKATADDRAFVSFVEEVARPYEQRGSQYLAVLNKIVDLVLPDGCPESWDSLEGKIKELVEYRAGGLNYDDMRESLAWIINNRAMMVLIENEEHVMDFLVRSGAGNALAGAPASDLGWMRSALKLADDHLSAAVEVMDENTPRTAVMKIWEVIRAARVALVSAPGPDEVEKMGEEHRHLTELYLKAGEWAEQLPCDSFDAVPDLVERLRRQRDTYRKHVNDIGQALRTLDGDWAGDVGARACEVINEAVSLRAFLKEAEEKLKEAEEKLANSYQVAPDVVITGTGLEGLPPPNMISA